MSGRAGGMLAGSKTRAHAPLAALERGIRHGGDPVRERLLVHGVQERRRIKCRPAADENEAVHPRAEPQGQVARDIRAEGASDDTEPSQTQLVRERGEVLHHGFVRWPLAVAPFAGEAIAQHVGSDCRAPLSQRHEVPQPGVRADTHAMDQHYAVVAFAMLKKAGPHSGNIGKRPAHEPCFKKAAPSGGAQRNRGLHAVSAPSGPDLHGPD
jgi:hypothetical protein